jgi:hypothetical protein
VMNPRNLPSVTRALQRCDARERDFARPCEALGMLCGEPGALVEKNVLRDAIWPTDSSRTAISRRAYSRPTFEGSRRVAS